MRLFHKTNIDFLKIKWICISLSILSIVIGTISLLLKGGPNLGIDFTGGAQIVYAFSKTPDEDQIRRIVEAANVKVVSVQRFDKPEKNEVLLRVPLEKKEGRDLSKEVTTALTKALFPKGADATAFDLNLNGGDVLLVQADRRRPREARDAAQRRPQGGVRPRGAGDHLRALGERPLRIRGRGREDPGRVARRRRLAEGEDGRRPLHASLGRERRSPGRKGPAREGHVGDPLLVGRDAPYIAFRFRSASFGTAAVVALIHDTWTTLGLCSILNLEISLTVVAAFLTLIGYSVNDTVVVFDRIRENREKSKRTPLVELVNHSINQTLSRTVLTSVLTFMVVVVLFFLGGEVLRGFSFVMIIGIIVGTYSSIFIAAPLVIVWEEWKQKRAEKKPRPAPAPTKGGKAAAAKARS